MALTVYDKVKWHIQAENTPKNMPEEKVATPIAFFLQWSYENNFLHSDIMEIIDSYLEHQAVINFKDLLLIDLDGILSSEELSSKGKRFMNAYYRDERSKFAQAFSFYLKDYDNFIKTYYGDNYTNDLYYTYEYTPENYIKIKQIIDERYKQYLNFSDKN
ncbi:MAG: hypothetical protein Q3983_04900 [Capnocytophaga sp.]|nr:hypothetical protein [Capnocytophaga sp.]